MRRHDLPAGAVARARALPLGATPAERRLWLALCEGLPEARFRRQAPIGPYFADFCSHAAKLIVEVDGAQHGEAMQYDAARTRFLEGEGYRVLRFWNNEVLQSLDGVLTAIMAALPELPPRKRVREEQDGFAALEVGSFFSLPPCGGERREAAADCPADHAPPGPLDPANGAGRSLARAEGPPPCVDAVETLRVRAGRAHPHPSPPHKGEGAHLRSATDALRARAFGAHPHPSPPHKGEGVIVKPSVWSSLDASS